MVIKITANSDFMISVDWWYGYSIKKYLFLHDWQMIVQQY